MRNWINVCLLGVAVLGTAPGALAANTESIIVPAGQNGFWKAIPMSPPLNDFCPWDAAGASPTSPTAAGYSVKPPQIFVYPSRCGVLKNDNYNASYYDTYLPVEQGAYDAVSLYANFSHSASITSCVQMVGYTEQGTAGWASPCQSGNVGLNRNLLIVDHRAGTSTLTWYGRFKADGIDYNQIVDFVPQATSYKLYIYRP